MKSLPQLHMTTASDTGCVQTVNADAICIREPSGPVELLQKGVIWAIADGVGSDESAARVSRLAAQAVVDAYWDSPVPSVSTRLRAAVEHANTVLTAQHSPSVAPEGQAGATMLAGVVVQDRLYLAHVGRSRAYLLRGERLRQLTDDHTWVAEQVRAGKLSPEAAATHPHRHVITRGLGVQDDIQVDTVEETLEPADVVLLCSDGLTRHVRDEHIAVILHRYGAAAAAVLVEEAKRLGGQDNVTAITLELDASQTSALDRSALLSRLGHELIASLDLDTTVHTVIHQLLALTGGDRAAILLRTADGTLVPKVIQTVSNTTYMSDFSHTVAAQALHERKPILIANALDDPRFQASTSIIEFSRRSVLCIPLLMHEDAIGALYVDSSTSAGIFDQADLDSLVAFASHAAVAIQNAQLHAALLARARELEFARARQDSIFRSLSSALIATDSHGNVTHWNPAAEQILAIHRADAIGLPLSQLLPSPVASWLTNLMIQAQVDTHTVVTGYHWEGAIGERKRVVLDGRVAQTRDAHNQPSGFVFILNDSTDRILIEEARQLERTERQYLRKLFDRYMAPTVVERLLHSPEAVQLGGARQEVTILFADVRGFTGFSESRPPEEVVVLLNRYLALATSEIFRQLGTVDKFIGDGVMAIFGAPLSVPDHELAAVRAALAMRARLDELRTEGGVRVGFGIGINSGQAIVGNIGTDERMSYTAIGDTVNVAARLQSEARSGEILISSATLERLAGQVSVEELGSIYVKGRLTPVNAYKVLQLTDRPES